MCLARSQAVSSELLRQFSACRPFNRDLNSYFTVLTFTRGECVILFLVCCVCIFFRAHLTTYYSQYTHNVLSSFFCRYIYVLTIMFSRLLFIKVISATTKTRNVFSIVDVSHRSKKERLQEVLRSISHRRSIFF